MQNIIKIIGNLVLIGYACFLSGCTKDQVTKFPPTGFSTDEFWKTETEVQQATNAAYLDLDGVEQIEWDGLTENVFVKTNNILQATTGALGPGSGIVNNLWTSSYARIRHANFFMENVGKSNLPENVLAKYKGQWRFIRAWAYYRLLYNFGDVPLVTKVLAVNEGAVETTSRQNVLNFAMSELAQAFTELSSSDYKPEKGRITKWAVLALQTRIELYEGTLKNDQSLLQKAVSDAKKIIDEGGFELYSNYTMLFRPEGEDNKETILSRVYVNLPGQTNALTAWLAPISFKASWDQVTPTKALRDMYLDLDGNPISQSATYDPNHPFLNRDGRMYQTIFEYDKTINYEGGIFINDGNTYNFRKYIDPHVEDQFKTHTNWILFRLGEVYLNNAEAKNEVSGPTQDVIDLINALRLRGGKAAAPGGTDIVVKPLALAGLTKESLRAIIRRERIVELAGEGLLYFDYHRWKWLETTMNKPAEAVTVLGSRVFTAPRDYLWPIPDFELINNSKLKQNSGW